MLRFGSRPAVADSASTAVTNVNQEICAGGERPLKSVAKDGRENGGRADSRNRLLGPGPQIPEAAGVK